MFSKFLCFDNRGPEELEAINDELEPIRCVWNLELEFTSKMCTRFTPCIQKISSILVYTPIKVETGEYKFGFAMLNFLLKFTTEVFFTVLLFLFMYYLQNHFQ